VLEIPKENIFFTSFYCAADVKSQVLLCRDFVAFSGGFAVVEPNNYSKKPIKNIPYRSFAGNWIVIG